MASLMLRRVCLIVAALCALPFFSQPARAQQTVLPGTLSGASTFAGTSGTATLTGNSALSGPVDISLGFAVEYFLVGGGGGGRVGGGGGGQVVTGTQFLAAGLTVTAPGNGGAGGDNNNGTAGVNTLFQKSDGAGQFSVIAQGGYGAGTNGGDAGNNTFFGGVGSSGASTIGYGGGGAGESANGQSGSYDFTNPPVPGAGGNGVASDITGVSTYYGGGGGAAAWDFTGPNSVYGAAGGLGGGGNGATGDNSDDRQGSSGVNGTGGGGGGGKQRFGGANAGYGGNGGGGIVVFRYLGAEPVGFARNGSQLSGTGSAAGSIVATWSTSGTTSAGDYTLTEEDLSARLGATITGDLSGSGGLTFNGPGWLALAGANSYAGATTAAAGTLLINGTLSNSDVSVSSGAILGGGGLIGGTASIAAGGIVSPGTALTGQGVLTLGGLSLATSATTRLTILGTTPGVGFDQVSILGGGPLAYGGVLDLSTSAIDAAPAGTSYKLFDFTGTPEGSFSSLTALGGGYSGITWSGPSEDGLWTSTDGTGGNHLTFTEGTGTLAVVPEPATLGLIAIAGLGGLVALRRRGRKA